MLLFIKGDLEWFCNDVGLPHWARELCCGLCLANKHGANYKDHRKRATWRQNVHDYASFRVRFMQPGCHPLLLWLTTVGPFGWALDTLHMIDYHGVCSHAVASVLCDIVRDDELGLGLQDATLAHLNGRLLAYYREFGISDRLVLTMKALTAESLSNFPMLSGPGIKGATCRALAPFVSTLAGELAAGDAVKTRRSLMMQGLLMVYSVLESSELCMCAANVEHLGAAMHQFLINYSYLASWHMLRGNVRYNLTFKHHYCQHLHAMAAATGINPAKVSTYTEESFVATGARLYNHNAYGTRTQSVVLAKWLNALQLKFALPLLAL